MRIWKPLTKFWYSNERNEFKYHTDFSLKEGESIETIINDKRLLIEMPHEGEIYKIHYEMAIEIFKEEKDVK